MWTWTKVAAAASFIVSAGCATGSSASGPAVGPMASMDGFRIQVENETTTSLRILALWGGSEVPLGRVDALGRQSLRVPAFAPATIQLVARPVASSGLDRRHVSDPIPIGPGTQVTWQLRASPGVSGVPHISTVRLVGCFDEAAC